MTIKPSAKSVSDRTNGVLIVGSTNRFDELAETLEREYGVHAAHVDAGNAHDHLDGVGCIVGGPGLVANGDPNVVERVRAKRSDLPIVFVYEDREAAADALVAGVDHCIRHDGRPASTRAAHVAAVLQGERRNERSDPEADESAFVHSALDALEDLFFVFSPDGEFIEWNATLVAVTGYTDEEIAALTPTDFVSVVVADGHLGLPLVDVDS